VNLKEMINEALGQSAFLQRDSFASNQDPDAIQMVAFANRAAQKIINFYRWTTLRKTHLETMQADVLSYDLPPDFMEYVPESMWKQEGARQVQVPTQDRIWGYLTAGNPGTGWTYYAKFFGDRLEFKSVSAGDVLQYDYIANYPVLDTQGNPKARFTEDTDTFLLNDETLILGTKAFWKAEKQMETAGDDRQEFLRSLRHDIVRDTGARTVRGYSQRFSYPGQSPLSSQYQW
jgi:hypothetical protein